MPLYKDDPKVKAAHAAGNMIPVGRKTKAKKAKKKKAPKRLEYEAPRWKSKKKPKPKGNIGTAIVEKKSRVAGLLKKFGLTK